jgi:hypothetical protein
MLDWDALREALQTALLEAVSARAGRPWRVAALDQVYAETDGTSQQHPAGLRGAFVSSG